jgi:hypothetical protein
MLPGTNKNHMQEGGIRKYLFIGLAVVGIIMAIVIIRQLSSTVSEVKPVIAEFMEAGTAKDVGAACACWAPRSVTEEQIADLIENSYHVFAGYECLNINQWNMEVGGGVTTCYGCGAVIYTGGQSLPLEASLQKEGEVWRIVGIHIGPATQGMVTRPPRSNDDWDWVWDLVW